MDITPYVDGLRRDLLNAADAAGEEARAVAERMLVAYEPAIRLALMDALSQAAAEITAELPTGVVEVRLRGREPQLVVDVPPPPTPSAAPRPPTASAAPPPPDGERSDGERSDGERLDGVDDATIARISLRLPESLKARAEELAARSGHSLNAWIVTVLRAATTQRAVNVDIDLSSIPFLDHPAPTPPSRGGRRMSGWV